MKTLNLVAAAVLAALAVSAQAAPGGPGPGHGCAAGAGTGNPDCPMMNGAGGKGERGARMLEHLKAADKNGDGMISREEAQASLPRIAEHFDEIDANKDGQLTFEEIRAARQAHRGAGHGPGQGDMWKRLDANGDGRLSREEVANAPRLSRDFDLIDTDKDGFLSPAELLAARQRFAGRGRP